MTQIYWDTAVTLKLCSVTAD